MTWCEGKFLKFTFRVQIKIIDKGNEGMGYGMFD